MDPKESGAAGEDSARPEPAAKVPLTPRKAAMPSASGDAAEPGLHLSPTSNEAAWERKNRIRPKSPKVPFDHSPKITDLHGVQPKITELHGIQPKITELHGIQPKITELHGIPPKITSVPRHEPRRGLLAFFRSRRKGRSRVWNLILLPIAVVIAFLVIFFLFKFH